MKALTGHTTQETAYLVEDYPYGFRLRCKIRYWLEYKRGNGFRLVSQTSNPKREGLIWNKPKASTYSPLGVMVLDEQEHVTWTALNVWAEAEEIDKFKAAFGAGFDEHQTAMLKYIEASSRASKRIHFSIVKPGDPPSACRQCGGPREYVTNPQGPQDIFKAVESTALCPACGEIGPAHQTMQQQSNAVRAVIIDELKKGA